MTPREEIRNERSQLIKKLSSAKFTGTSETSAFIEISKAIGISHITVRNYIRGGKAPDGIIGYAILRELQKLKFVK